MLSVCVIKNMKKDPIIEGMDKLVEIMKSNDRFIYHYTSAKVAREFILSNGTMRFSNIQGLNDPEESTKYDSIFLDNTENNEKPDSMSTLMSFKRAFPSSVFSSSYCNDNKENGPYTGVNLFETINSHVNKGFMKSRMWGTYGDHHAGVCLCFDKEKLLESFNKAKQTNFEIYGEEIKYSKNIMDYISKFSPINKVSSPTSIKANKNTISEFRKHVLSNKDFFFFWKQIDWKDENEFKIILVNDKSISSTEIFLPFNDSLFAIFMGERFSLESKNDCFKHYCKSNNISAFRVMYKGGFTHARPFNFNYIK